MNGLRWSSLRREFVADDLPLRNAALSSRLPVTGTLPGSSAVEHPTVNRTAACSNQARGAIFFSQEPFRAAIHRIGADLKESEQWAKPQAHQDPIFREA